jgi:hypothetical protein
MAKYGETLSELAGGYGDTHFPELFRANPQYSAADLFLRIPHPLLDNLSA